MMPNSDPQDRFFYPTLTLMIDSYILSYNVSHCLITCLKKKNREIDFVAGLLVNLVIYSIIYKGGIILQLFS